VRAVTCRRAFILFSPGDRRLRSYSWGLGAVLFFYIFTSKFSDFHLVAVLHPYSLWIVPLQDILNCLFGDMEGVTVLQLRISLEWWHNWHS